MLHIRPLLHRNLSGLQQHVLRRGRTLLFPELLPHRQMLRRPDVLPRRPVLLRPGKPPLLPGGSGLLRRAVLRLWGKLLQWLVLPRAVLSGDVLPSGADVLRGGLLPVGYVLLQCHVGSVLPGW